MTIVILSEATNLQLRHKYNKILLNYNNNI